jgi:Ca2+-binding EF-hand superfamily protein
MMLRCLLLLLPCALSAQDENKPAAPPRSAAVPPGASAPDQLPGGTASTPRKPPQPQTDKPRPVVILQTYDEASSRAAFAAVDRDADDRLSVLEFAAAQDEPAAADPRDPSSFRRFDTNRDGFLGWPEFDARMRNAIRLTGEFRYRPARTLPTPKASSPTPLPEDAKEMLDAQVVGLLALLDTDRDARLSRDEFATLLASADLPASSLTQFVQADRDNDRKLDKAEIGTLTRLLPNLPRGPQVQPSVRSFSVAWRRADLDGDGEIAVPELEAVLRGHDIHLGRWVDKVIADADRSGDRRLGPAEVMAAQRAPDKKDAPSDGKR